jgi:hypothetical protein
MKSALPPELETKRLAIARVHNRLIIGVLLGFWAVAASIVFLSPRPISMRTLALYGVLVGAGVIYAMYRIIRYDKAISARLGFVCPHCQAPLYEPRGFINVTGICPKCKRSVIGK